MKIRILSIACVTTAAALLVACTTVYKNTDACEQLMRSKLAEKSSDTLKTAHRGAGIDGSRVVVEGSIEHVMTASEVGAASAASAAASSARVAAGPSSASGVRGVSAASSASAASAAGASGAEALSLKPAKPKKVVLPAAAECTFHGSALNAFSWLAPAKLATPVDEDDSAATQ